MEFNIKALEEVLEHLKTVMQRDEIAGMHGAGDSAVDPEAGKGTAVIVEMKNAADAPVEGEDVGISEEDFEELRKSLGY